MSALLKAVNLTKRFGGQTAVEKANLDINAGEVIGVVGDNGAGKSTLVKLLTGVYRPDEGEIVWRGKPVRLKDPRDARALGMETVYQDLALADNLDVAANIFLGREIKRSRFRGLVRTLDRDQMRAESAKALARLGIPVPDVTPPVRDLPGDQRQAVAIARALYWKAKLIILDEPTAALGVAEQRLVLALARTLGEEGVAVILVSHNVRDVFAVADRILVMRRGKKVGELAATKSTPDQVTSLMVGAEAAIAMGVPPPEALAFDAN